MGIRIKINQINTREALQPAARHHPAGAATDQQQMARCGLSCVEPLSDLPGGVAPLAAPPQRAYVPAQTAGGIA